MWKHVPEQGRSQMIIWCMHIACWIPKATNAHTDCEILNPFPLQQWLHEHTSMLCDTQNVCLVSVSLLLLGSGLGLPEGTIPSVACRKWGKSLKQLAFRPVPPKSKKCQLLNSQSLSSMSTDSGDAITKL